MHAVIEPVVGELSNCWRHDGLDSTPAQPPKLKSRQHDQSQPHVDYSSTKEAQIILDKILNLAPVPDQIAGVARAVRFVSSTDLPRFPIPFKETEVGAALKAIEASLALAIAEARSPSPSDQGAAIDGSRITIDLERTTAFLFQTYLASIGGFKKHESGASQHLKSTDLRRAQSDRYRRLSANLYKTRDPGKYYHIHGSLDACPTLRMLGLQTWRPDLTASGHDAIVAEIESHVEQYSVEELERLNQLNRQAGCPALTYAEFLETEHGKANKDQPPWSIDALETSTPPAPPPALAPGSPRKPLAGIKVLDVSRIIAAPTVGRILAEYGADVLKVNAEHLSDVPFFQVDGNMGKRAAALDLKSAPGRRAFEALLADADVLVDGYRPGAMERLGYGPRDLAALAQRRGRGYVYVGESCFGHVGAWARRPGWQQIADCATGLAWEQGRFMGLDEPVVPPFPISDYGTGCMGAVAALTGLHRRATAGGSWHGRVSLMHYDLLLLRMGPLPPPVQRMLLLLPQPEDDGKGGDGDGNDAHLVFPRDIRHSHSVDQVSGAALRLMMRRDPAFFHDAVPRATETWRSAGFGTDVMVVQPVAQITGFDLGFSRGSRPNGADPPSWSGFAGPEDDKRVGVDN